jgi:glycosyltransferase involved in cell wall biosynthesis
LKIAILGTRGIPNNYGGFEQFAEYLSTGLVERGHEVFVYNSHNHSYRENTWRSVNIIHCYDPEYFLGTVGQFIYDLNCTIDSRKRGFDIILQLGYTSSSVWHFLMPRNPIIITNMDGLEWKRTKYRAVTQRFLKYAENLAIKKSDYLIADSLGIKRYLFNKYSAQSEYIPYGATVFDKPDMSFLDKYRLEPFSYDMLIARLEPENSLEIILKGVADSEVTRKFLVIGNFHTSYGKYLRQCFAQVEQIIFIGSLYDLDTVNNLRYYSNLYFHGHTVGGTNPSLLEAMASNALIAANNNEFNLSILGSDAYFFSNAEEVTHLLNTIKKGERELPKLSSNIEKIRSLYSWTTIRDSYEKLFTNVLQKRR